jgi:methylenetetrahydrofolate dehydrogenase (NADP+)/methenyltetrahydrofolate cyclohydrolase
MTAELIDGKAVANKVQLAVSEGAAAFRAAHGRAPRLQLILVGDDADSHKHVRSKEKAAAKVGLLGTVEVLPADTSQAALLARVDAANRDAAVDGILVQLPLPAQIQASAIFRAIDPAKDVDGLTPHNAGLLALGQPVLAPCTPLGCIRLLDEVGCQLAGARALVVGRSALVGRPIVSLLLARHATVTVAHSHTRDLAALVAEADVLVSAAGRAALVRGAWIKPGAVVIDVGQNRDQNGKLCGDVEPEPARERAAFITPVPGGVGPMTIAMLLANTLAAAQVRVSRAAT